MGVNAETTTRAFREADVEHFFKRPYVPVPYIRHVFTAVDPAGGGASAFAVSSIGLNNTGDVIVRKACIFVCLLVVVTPVAMGFLRFLFPVAMHTSHHGSTFAA